MSLPSRVYTTSQKMMRDTYPWLYLWESRKTNPDGIWVFLDGNSNGWHSAVVVEPNQQVRHISKFKETEGLQLGGDLYALITGLKLVPKNSVVYILFHFIGLGAWSIKTWRAKNPAVKNLVSKAREIIEEKKLDPVFIHHKAGEKDQSEFTRWFKIADDLVQGEYEIDRIISWSALDFTGEI